MEGDCKFAVIGNKNAVSYKEFFPLVKENKVWLGQEFNKTMNFAIPDEYFVKEGSEDKDNLGRNVVKVPAICWFTNIPHGKRYEPLSLMTKADNERFNKKVTSNPHAYKKYDNYDAIEVPATSAIPSDYKGFMGVPISFLTKYCPEQFEIILLQAGNTETAASPEELKRVGYIPKVVRGGGGAVEGKIVYARILIKHKNPESSPENPS